MVTERWCRERERERDGNAQAQMADSNDAEEVDCDKTAKKKQCGQNIVFRYYSSLFIIMKSSALMSRSSRSYGGDIGGGGATTSNQHFTSTNIMCNLKYAKGCTAFNGIMLENGIQCMAFSHAETDGHTNSTIELCKKKNGKKRIK